VNELNNPDTAQETGYVLCGNMGMYVWAHAELWSGCGDADESVVSRWERRIGVQRARAGGD